MTWVRWPSSSGWSTWAVGSSPLTVWVGSPSPEEEAPGRSTVVLSPSRPWPPELAGPDTGLDWLPAEEGWPGGVPNGEADGGGKAEPGDGAAGGPDAGGAAGVPLDAGGAEYGDEYGDEAVSVPDPDCPTDGHPEAGALDDEAPYGDDGPDAGALDGCPYGEVPDVGALDGWPNDEAALPDGEPVEDSDDDEEPAAAGPNGEVRSPVPDVGTPEVAVDAVGASCAAGCVP